MMRNIMMNMDAESNTITRIYELPLYPEEERELSCAQGLCFSETEQAVLADLMRSRIKECKEYGEEAFEQISSHRCLSFRENEIESCASLVKTEFEQELFDEYTSGENWTEFSIMHAFRITKDIFDQKRVGVEKPGKSSKTQIWPFSEDKFCAADDYLKRDLTRDIILYENLSIQGSSSQWTETVWWEVYNIYVKDLATIPGYIHIFYAIGVTEFHTDHH